MLSYEFSRIGGVFELFIKVTNSKLICYKCNNFAQNYIKMIIILKLRKNFKLKIIRPFHIAKNYLSSSWLLQGLKFNILTSINQIKKIKKKSANYHK